MGFDHRTAQRSKPARTARNRRQHYPLHARVGTGRARRAHEVAYARFWGVEAHDVIQVEGEDMHVEVKS